MSDVVLYDAGLRINREYVSLIQSRNEGEVDEHIEILKIIKPEGSEIVKHKKHYRCVSCTPQIIY